MNKMERRRVAVVTGTRSEYGLLRPIMSAVTGNSRLELQTVVTGMHLSREYGETWREIVRDGFVIHKKIDMVVSNDSTGAMAKSIGLGLLGLTQALEELLPEFVVVLGDRVEAFAGAVSAALLKRMVVHIHGGDKARGGFDDYLRHAITKMSHLHFCVSESSRERVIRLGEDPQFVWNVGAPGLDAILHAPRAGFPVIAERYHLTKERGYVLMVQHSVSTQNEASVEQVRATLSALREVALPVVIIYPNSDAGGRAIIEEYQNWQQFSAFQFHKSVPREDYLGLLENCRFLIGNSSSGIIESTTLRIPVVNIGIRQEGRECGENVLHVPPEAGAITNAIRHLLESAEFGERVRRAVSPYGDGTAGKRIAEILATVPLDPKILEKQITY